jgi:hypothetical protein
MIMAAVPATVVTLGFAGPAVAAPTTIDAGTSVTAPYTAAGVDDYLVDNNQWVYWSLVALDAKAPGNYDLEMRTPAGALVASTTGNQVWQPDFIAIDDNNKAAPGAFGVRAIRRTTGPGPGGPGEYTIGYENEAKLLYADGIATPLPLGREYTVRDVYIAAGKTLTMVVGKNGICPSPPPGTSTTYDLSFYLMGHGTAGDPKAPFRTSAQAVMTSGIRTDSPSCSLTMTYKATTGGYYGFVVKNRNLATKTTPPITTTVS